jgi:hypothetical protein
MKDAIINMKISKHLYDAVKAEADRYGVTMSAFIRATLAKQVLGDEKSFLDGHTVLDPDGAYIFELGPSGVNRESSKLAAQADYARGIFESTARTLERGARILSDTSREKPYDSISADGKKMTTIPAYTKTLDLDFGTDYSAACRRGEVIFGHGYEWITKRAKQIKGDHAHRLAQAEWFKTAAEAIRQTLEEELDPQFWIDSLAKSAYRGAAKS